MSNENIKIIFDPADYENLAATLKEAHMDYYLFAAFMYYSGYFSTHFLGRTNKEITAFIESNTEILPKFFIEEVKEHMQGKKASDCFLLAKPHDGKVMPLSKRTAENAVINACRKIGIPNVGSYVFVKSFIWNQYRHTNYDLDYVNKILRSRKRPAFNSQEAILEYCGLTSDHLLEDVHKNSSYSRDTLCNACKEIADFFQNAYYKIATLDEVPSELIGFESVIYQTKNSIQKMFPKGL